MLSCKLFLALLGLSTVQAIIRPGYGGHHYGGGGGGYDGKDCEEPTKATTVPAAPTTTPVVTTPTTTVTTTVTTPVIRPACLSGWTLYQRSSGPWCMKVITAVNITVNAGDQLCASNNAVLTAFENAQEQAAVMAEAQPYIQTTLGLGSGSIAMAGRRRAGCVTNNATSMAQPGCTGATTAFLMPASANTNPAYLWTTWAVDEPNNGYWPPAFEDCLQFHIKPSDPKQHGLINDFYCDYTYAPNSPDDPLYKNQGALCGQAASLEANGK